MLELNKIYNADCLDIMKEIPDKYFDLVLTDPPYNVNLNYNSHNDNMNNYYEWCSDWFSEIMRLSKCCLITVGMVNMNFWYSKNPLWTIPWIKSNQCSHSRIGGFNVWEPVLVFGKPYKKIPRDLIEEPISMQQDAAFHVCPKSLKAWKKLVSDFTNENDLILDPFSGSGTTAIACHNLNRKFVCIEKDKDYYEKSVKRYEEHIKQFKMF